MLFSGEANVPGAAGNLFAGGPSFDIRRGQGALGGRSGGPQPPLAGMMGGMGNMAGLANAQFYGGPQMTQLPPGMVKTVY